MSTVGFVNRDSGAKGASLAASPPARGATSGIVLELRGRASRMFVVAAMALCLAVATLPSARAEVVYGNMGPSGTGSFSSGIYNPTNTSGTTTGVFRNLAMAFVTGSNSNFLDVTSVTLGLGTNVSASAQIRTVQILPNIFNGTSNVPDALGTPLGTSSPTTIAGFTGVAYTFNFPTPVSLAANTQYWVVPVRIENQNYRWHQSGLGTSTSGAVAYNDSGYTRPAIATARQDNTNTWVTGGTLGNYALSVVAVPEPATLMLAAIGIMIGGVAVARARSRSASLVS